jgi:hypothetical protein
MLKLKHIMMYSKWYSYSAASINSTTYLLGLLPTIETIMCLSTKLLHLLRRKQVQTQWTKSAVSLFATKSQRWLARWSLVKTTPLKKEKALGGLPRKKHPRIRVTTATASTQSIPQIQIQEPPLIFTVSEHSQQNQYLQFQWSWECLYNLHSLYIYTIQYSTVRYGTVRYGTVKIIEVCFNIPFITTTTVYVRWVLAFI